MSKGPNRVYIDRTNIKVLAVEDDGCAHKELPFDFVVMQKYYDWGYKVYAINDEGVFFFTNNRSEDGNDWCKITKVE